MRDLDWVLVWNNYDAGLDRPVDLYGSFNALAELSGAPVEFDPSLQSSSYGGWFYRPATVSVPAAGTAWLFISAVLGLGARHRKKQ